MLHYENIEGGHAGAADLARAFLPPIFLKKLNAMAEIPKKRNAIIMTEILRKGGCHGRNNS